MQLTPETVLATVASPWSDAAERAEGAQAWASAARSWRHHLTAEPTDASARLRFGECLLRLGHFAQAEGEFQAAQQDASAQDVAGVALLRLGQLALADNRLEGAAALFQKVCDMAGADLLVRSAALSEAARLREVAGFDEAAETVPVRLLFSGPSMGPRQEAGSPTVKLGAADYSYAYAARGFLQALDAAGIVPEPLNHPEYVADGPIHFNAQACVHLRFSPPTNPRLVKGATNILLFAWEFDELPPAGNRLHPFADRRAMIERYDEVWMPSRHGQRVVAQLTTADVRYVPSPVLPGSTRRFWSDGRFQRAAARPDPLPTLEFVPLSVFPQRQHLAIAWATREARTLGEILKAGSGAPRQVFLTIANPHDQRKNLRPLLEAFATYARRHPEAILLVKASAHDFTTFGINDLIFTHQLARREEVLEAFVSPNIWICNEKLSEADLDELYAAADFYICSPFAEGQNLPLLEAMLRGCVAVTPRHTAMLDYITPDNAVVIDSRRATPSDHLRSIYELDDAEIDMVETADVMAALKTAGALLPDQVAALRENGFRTVEQQFGPDVVVREWQRLCGQLGLTTPTPDGNDAA